MKIKFFAVLTALCVLSFTAFAQWRPFTSPTNASGAYWDNASYDGAKCNIGYVLNGSAGSVTQPCTNQRPTWLPYVGATPTLERTASGFGSLFAPATATLTLYGDIAYENGRWGWYDATTGVETNLNGLAVNTPTTIGSNSHAWGLFAQLTDGTIARSTGNQFAFFGFGTVQSPNLRDFLFGIEDITVANGSDRDYNDVVGRLSFDRPLTLGVVPEPSTTLLLMFGLAALGYIKFRKYA